jgi:adenosylmethionine-8-amino-7-oxononanoate aminotransferase
MAKGISSCYIPFGAVAVSEAINAPFEDGAYFVHGFTSGGHPLACAAGIELINIVRDENLLDNCRTQGERLFGHRDRLLEHPTVKDVRGWGLMLVLELVSDKQSMEFFDPDQRAEHLFQALAMKNGLVMYGTLYGPRRQPAFRRGLPAWISPPLSITGAQVDDLIDRLDSTLTEWESTLLR